MCSVLLSFQAICLKTASLKSVSSVGEGQTAGRDEQLRNRALVSMQISYKEQKRGRSVLRDGVCQQRLQSCFPWVASSPCECNFYTVVAVGLMGESQMLLLFWTSRGLNPPLCGNFAAEFTTRESGL